MICKNILPVVLSLLFSTLALCADEDLTYSKYNIENIKRMDVEDDCNASSDCPEYALGCENSHCVYPEFACSGNDNCYILNAKKNYNMFMDDDEKSVYTVLENDNTSKKIIVKSCSENKANNCKTAECSKNEDCLSKVCSSGVCQTNKSSPTYHCKVSGLYYMCSSLLNEHCTTDNNCASFRCDEDKYICINEKKLAANTDTNGAEKIKSYIVYVAAGLLALKIILF